MNYYFHKSSLCDKAKEYLQSWLKVLLLFAIFFIVHLPYLASISLFLGFCLYQIWPYTYLIHIWLQPTFWSISCTILVLLCIFYFWHILSPLLQSLANNNVKNLNW